MTIQTTKETEITADQKPDLVELNSLTERKKGLDLWIKQATTALENNRSFYTEESLGNAKLALRLIDAASLALPPAVADWKLVSIGNTQFSVRSIRLEDYFEKKKKDGTYVREKTKSSIEGFALIPFAEKKLFDPSWFLKVSGRYVGSLALNRNGFINSIWRDKDPLIPLQITICLPADFEFEGKKVSAKELGWVQDVGPGIIHTPEASRGLPARLEGHIEHETWHRFLHTVYPNFYYAVLRPHPYLDEALAITSTLRHYSSEKNMLKYLDSRRELTNPIKEEYPVGMEQSYYYELDLRSLLNPLTFDQLDGFGVFDSTLYARRLVLAEFFLVALWGKTFPPNQELKSAEDFLVHGLIEMKRPRLFGARNAFGDMYKKLVEMIMGLEIKARKGNKISDQDFWKEFLLGTGFPQLANQTAKASFEEAYLAHAGKVFTLYNLLKLSGLKVSEYWAGVPNELKLQLPNTSSRLEDYINLFRSDRDENFDSFMQSFLRF